MKNSKAGLFAIGFVTLALAALAWPRNVTVDFTYLQNGGHYTLTFVDANNVSTVFDSVNGLIQSKTMHTGTYQITLTKIVDAACPGYVQIANGVFISDLSTNTGSANLLRNYQLVLQCR